MVLAGDWRKRSKCRRWESSQRFKSKIKCGQNRQRGAEPIEGNAIWSLSQRYYGSLTLTLSPFYLAKISSFFFLKTNVSFFFFLITMLTNQCSDSGLKSTSLQNQLQSQQQKKGQQKGKKQFCLRKLAQRMWFSTMINGKLFPKTPFQFFWAIRWPMWVVRVCKLSCWYKLFCRSTVWTKRSYKILNSLEMVVISYYRNLQKKSVILIPCLTWLTCYSRNSVVVEISVLPSGINMMISASQYLQEHTIKSESVSFPSESQSPTCVQPVCTGEVRLDPRRITAQHKSSPGLPMSFFSFSPFCSRLYSCTLFPWLETGNNFFLPF